MPIIIFATNFSMKASEVPRLQVKLGDHNINSLSDAVTQDVGVANIIKHKGFSQRTLVRIMISNTLLLILKIDKLQS